MNSKKFALIGYPLGHSLSPFIHSELFKIRKIKGEYSLIETESEQLENTFNNRLKKLDGFNVTIPYKTELISLVDTLSERAKLYGALNTVKVKDGKTYGYNTDCIGFLRSLENAGIALEGSVLICGCGGVSRMFAFESVLNGADVTLAVRKKSFEKASLLKEEIKNKTGYEIIITDIEKAEGSYALIINGTPVGMSPNVENCPVSKDVIRSCGAVFDAIYNPFETLLIKYAKEYDKKYVNGLPMLVLQAVAAQEIWFDTTFEKEDVNRVISLCEKRLKLNE